MIQQEFDLWQLVYRSIRIYIRKLIYRANISVTQKEENSTYSYCSCTVSFLPLRYIYI